MEQNVALQQHALAAVSGSPNREISGAGPAASCGPRSRHL